MKKTICALLICVLLASSSIAVAADIDLSSMTYAELVNLQAKIQRAIMETEEWQEVSVPAGLYQVGVDIPAGKWNVSMRNKWARIKIGTKLESNLNEVSSKSPDYYTVQINKDVPSQVISFIDGQYVEIYNAGVVFTTPTGSSLTFK